MKNNHIFLLFIILTYVCASCGGNPLATDPREDFLGKYSGQSYEIRSLAIAPTNEFNYSYAAALEIQSSENDDEVSISLELCHPNGEELDFDFIGTVTDNKTIIIFDKQFLGLMGDQNTQFTDVLIEFSTDVNIKITAREIRTNATNNQALDDDDYSSNLEMIFNEKGSNTLNC